MPDPAQSSDVAEVRVLRAAREPERCAYAALTEARYPDPARPRRLIRRLRVAGLLPAHWLRQRCEAREVLVYGLEDREPPFLIEDREGRLALVDPGWL